MTLQVGNRDTFTASKAVLGNKETTLGSRVRSGIEGLRYYIDWTFLNECKGQKAELFTRYLKDAPRHVSIREALNDARTVTVKTFLKDVKGSVDSRIRKLKNELLAFQLGMDAVLFDLPCNAGFLKFASSPPLERYLFEYNHQLQVDPLTQEIQILADGKYMPWSSAKGMIAEAPSSKPLQRWMYGSKGLQNKNMYEWSELQPYKKGDPATWDHQYIFEYCVCCTDNPNKTGDHTWIRLKTPEGDIYSVGLYRPSKRDWRDNYKFPLRLKKGYLMQPDVSEFWPTDIFKIPVAITKEHFLQMKKMLETDKRNDKLVFQLFHRNCTLYVAKIAAIAHIKLPTAKLAWHFLTPSLVEKKIEKIALYLPEIVVKIVRVVVGVFLNFFLLALGATIVDAAVFEKNNQQEPHIKNLSDFFDYRKTELNHPNILGKEIAAGIAKWRTSEIARLEKLKISGAFKENEEVDAEIKRVRFALPAAYYTL